MVLLQTHPANESQQGRRSSYDTKLFQCHSYQRASGVIVVIHREAQKGLHHSISLSLLASGTREREISYGNLNAMLSSQK